MNKFRPTERGFLRNYVSEAAQTGGQLRSPIFERKSGVNPHPNIRVGTQNPLLAPNLLLSSRQHVEGREKRRKKRRHRDSEPGVKRQNKAKRDIRMKICGLRRCHVFKLSLAPGCSRLRFGSGGKRISQKTAAAWGKKNKKYLKKIKARISEIQRVKSG